MPDGAALAIAAVVGLKYLLPLAIIPFPFLAGWANFVLDTVDGDVLVPLGAVGWGLPAGRQGGGLRDVRVHGGGCVALAAQARNRTVALPTTTLLRSCQPPFCNYPHTVHPIRHAD